jgi:hypothetical protein
LSVYSNREPTGLDVLSAEGAPLGKGYAIPTAISLEGPPMPDLPAASAVLEDSTGGTGVIDAGKPFEVTLVLVGGASNSGDLLNVTLRGAGWELHQTAAYPGKPVLAWHRFILPPDATGGEASLAVEDAVIARYTLHAVERLFDPPAFATPVEASFPGIGDLVGATLRQAAVSLTEPPDVTLVWQAEMAASIPYTVFVQLLDTNGRLLAQSDSQPVGGERPTTGWLAGEYLEDNHRLVFRVQDYTGPAFLIAGFYDPANGRRVISTRGEDHVRLPLEIMVVGRVQ